MAKAKWKQIYEDALDASAGPAEAMERLTVDAGDLAKKFPTVRGMQRKQVMEDIMATKHAIDFAQKQLKQQARVNVVHLAHAVAELRTADVDPASFVATLAEVAIKTAKLDKKHGAASLEKAARMFTEAANTQRKKGR
jgi:hypothetical protein